MTSTRPVALRSPSIYAYALTVFLSAFLLFQVQPLMGKFILPWFGGSPAVWTTCMLIFQVLLFGGYAYAHVTSTWLSGRQQAWLHIVLLVTAMAMLPIAPGADWKPTNSEAPAARIMLLMIACVGLPYFVLSATGPLLQQWFCRTHHGVSPYRLYALSNVGSLLALISYPFAFEPLFSVQIQSWIWSIAFATFALLCAWVGWSVGRTAGGQSSLPQQAHENAESSRTPTLGLKGLWLMLAMTPSLLLLASTNQVCMDVAVIPFLWVLPLALYLITFILCFDSDRWYHRKPFVIGAMVLQLASIYLVTRGSNVSILLQIAIYFGGMFCSCMVCHGELARLRPGNHHLTLYYLTISAGGALGGLFVGLLAPLLFVGFYELQLGIFCFLLAYLCLRVAEDKRRAIRPHWLGPAAVAFVLVLAVFGVSRLGRQQPDALKVARNFYGVLKVERVDDPQEAVEPTLQLVHGRIAHGAQFISATRQQVPTAYYAECTGIGQLMLHGQSGPPRHIGIVGLGIGTLAAYGRAGDAMRMYEINPNVISIAREDFSFLQNSPAKLSVVEGDARLSLEFEPPQQFDVLVLDAFSGDAIPLHLLTREAVDVYIKHLKPDGILAFHISNLHFNLRPVIRGLAQEFGLQHHFVTTAADPNTAARTAHWAFMAKSTQPLTSFANFTEESEGADVGRPVTWTDARNNLLEVMW